MDLPPRPQSDAGPRRRRGVFGVLAAVMLALVAGACMPTLVDPPTSGKNFGQGPLEAVNDAAIAQAACGLTSTQLAAMMMAPTYGEAGGPVPSPMALSRYDNVSVNSTNVNLFSFGHTTGAYVNAFWSPGIGMWQFDSAGGWPFSAAGAIDSVTAANQAATTISYRWCNAPTSQQVDDATRRKYAWGPWYGCSTTSTCESIYASLVAGDKLDTAFDPTVTRYGGMQQRTCNVAGIGDGITCWYVNPTLAQGSKGWTGGTYNGTGSGVTPLPKPFYVVESAGKEYRIWLQADTGYDIGITASKTITANARTSLTWTASAALCDVTGGRGACSGRIAQTPSGPRMADPFGSLDTAVAGVDRTVTASGWAIDPDTSDPIDVHVYVDGVLGGGPAGRQQPSRRGPGGTRLRRRHTDIEPWSAGSRPELTRCAPLPSTSVPTARRTRSWGAPRSPSPVTRSGASTGSPRCRPACGPEDGRSTLTRPHRSMCTSTSTGPGPRPRPPPVPEVTSPSAIRGPARPTGTTPSWRPRAAATRCAPTASTSARRAP